MTLRLLPSVLLLAACSGGQPIGPDVPDPIDTGEETCDRPATWYADIDEDGFGDPGRTKEACERPYGFVENARDCDDLDDAAFPGNLEACDGIDNDCDGEVDGLNAVDSPAWHPDADGDGFGDAETAIHACEQPSPDLSLTGNDCDDSRADVHPGADDPPCDGIDHDCGGVLEVEAAFLGGAPYPTAQAAFDASVDGDTIDLCAGDHPVRFEATRSVVRIVGHGGSPDAVVLHPPDAGRILDLDAPDVELVGLTLSGGDTAGEGGAARIGATRLHLRDVVLRDSRATSHGGALSARVAGEGFELWLEDVDLLDNRSGGDGGALHVLFGQSGTALLDGGIHARNHAEGDGGAVFVSGTGSTSNGTPRDIEAFENVAGGSGGWFSLSGVQHAIFRGERLELGDHEAGDSGGVVSVRAPVDGKIALRSSTLAGGVAPLGGCLRLEGLGTLDLELSSSFLSDCHAEQGGVVHATLGGTGHFDWLGATLSDASADRGAAVWLTGFAEKFDGAIDGSTVSDTSGAPAIEVDPELLTPSASVFHVSGSAVLRNAGGGISVPEGFTVDLDGADMGTDADDNGAFDVRTDGTTFRWDGSASATCLDGACE